MELVEVQVKVPKETKEIADAIVNLVKVIKEKKDLTVMITEEIPFLIKAIEGYDKVKEEAKEPEIAMALGLMVGEIGQILMKK